ncbi:uncharacterized protein LOC117642796 [Thrips palmi]|uniref:Uncharacterized protein LOC117642796 n=1 Tax=Thrips palmi TaxID=161013 RepID=A0A6P8YJN6_THRPL|nr:uncharacterized protein LOC117642796 [Thrips palmi]
MLGKMFQGQTDSVPSPAQPTGVLSEALEVLPKPNSDRQVGQSDSISKISSPQLSRNTVVTDAVPSPARPRETVNTELEQKIQTEQNLKSPLKSPPKSPPKSPAKTESPNDNSDQNEPKRSSGFSSRRPHHRSKASNEPRSKTVISIVGGTNFTIGPTYHQYQYIVRGNNNQYEEGIHLRKMESRKKEYNKLLSSQDELLEEDIIIVSESLDDRGLRSLLRELPLDEQEADLIEREFGCKGHSEIIFQILSRWKCLMSEEGQKPRLGSFSSKLLPEDVYRNGGKKALKGLRHLHSSND